MTLATVKQNTPFLSYCSNLNCRWICPVGLRCSSDPHSHSLVRNSCTGRRLLWASLWCKFSHFPCECLEALLQSTLQMVPCSLNQWGGAWAFLCPSPLCYLRIWHVLLKNSETLVHVVQTKLRLVTLSLRTNPFLLFGVWVSCASAGPVQGCADEHSGKGCMHTFLVRNAEQFLVCSFAQQGSRAARSSGQQLAALILPLPTVSCFTYTLLSHFDRCWSWDATDNGVLLWFILGAGPVLCRKGGKNTVLPVRVMSLFHNTFTQDSQMRAVQTCYFPRVPK